MWVSINLLCFFEIARLSGEAKWGNLFEKSGYTSGYTKYYIMMALLMLIHLIFPQARCHET